MKRKGINDVGDGIEGVIVKKEDVKKQKVDIVYERSRQINRKSLDKLYDSTRFYMNLLPGVSDSYNTNKAFLFENKSLQDLIIATRALSDAYNQDIPGSTRLSNGNSRLVRDSEWTNLYACLCYVKRQLYPLVLENNNFDESLMCHFECILDLFDGKQ